jgi:Pvc16 N-terminal domain
MFIRDVDEGLERLVRARLPLPETVGDVSFDPPTGVWSAQLSRLTVNFFLYHLDRSSQPTRAPQTRLDGNGRPERRGAQPMIELGYLMSAWAGSPRDEHQLLGDLVSLFGGLSALPAEFLSPALNSTVVLAFGTDDFTRPREIWQGVNGQLKACAIVKATVAADTWDWQDEAPAVQRIAVLSSPLPRSS